MVLSSTVAEGTMICLKDLIDHLGNPPQATLWTIHGSLLIMKLSYLIGQQHREINNQLALLHLLVVHLHCGSKISESGLKSTSTSHPNQLLIFSLNLQSGIKLADHCLIPIMMKLKHFLLAHNLDLLHPVCQLCMSP